MRYTRDQVIKGFRELADHLEARPDLPIETYGSDYDKSKPADSAITIDYYCDKDEFYMAARNIGKGEKDANEYQFTLSRRFGEGAVELQYECPRGTVCERKEVGVKTRTISAKPAEPERVVEEKIYEYECPPLLSGFGDDK